MLQSIIINFNECICVFIKFSAGVRIFQTRVNLSLYYSVLKNDSTVGLSKSQGFGLGLALCAPFPNLHCLAPPNGFMHADKMLKEKKMPHLLIYLCLYDYSAFRLDEKLPN